MAQWLILGGTRFVGHHIAQEAIRRGHHVTLFHRGSTPAALEGEYQEILGDRDGGLAALAGGRWGVVADICGYLPRLVGDSARVLAGAEVYCFISSLSVYQDRPLDLSAIREGDALRCWSGSPTEEITEHSYGPLKVDCERAVQRRFGRRALILRPGYVVGPRDHSRRFSWWVRRLARPGRVLRPDNDQAPIQVIDGRDLAHFAVRATERRLQGPYNLAGPALTWAQVYDCCLAAGGGRAQPVPVPEAWLSERALDEEELPMWLPRERLGESLIADSGRALAAGLQRRPLALTVRDILATPPVQRDGPQRLSWAREQALLEELAAAG